MPMQGPQPHSSTRAPAAMSLASAPLAARAFSTWREPGETVRLTLGATCRPASMPATRIMSQKEEFVQLPMHTWSMGSPAIFETSVTLSGLLGCAAIGCRLERSMVISSSYSASGSASSSRQSPALPRAAKNSRVLRSLGKMEVVAPVSAPMLAMVARSGTLRLIRPSPKYSNILPTPPLTPTRRSSSSITSLAATIGFRWPVSVTRQTLGMVK